MRVTFRTKSGDFTQLPKPHPTAQTTHCAARATRRTRTSDRLITNQLLYRLSYGGHAVAYRSNGSVVLFLVLSDAYHNLYCSASAEPIG